MFRKRVYSNVQRHQVAHLVLPCKRPGIENVICRFTVLINYEVSNPQIKKNPAISTTSKLCDFATSICETSRT